MSAFSIAIDGPAGAGKSTAAKGVAERLHMSYLDTGAMYRAVGLYMLRNDIQLEDETAVTEKCRDIDITVDYSTGNQRTFLNKEDVTEKIRTDDCTQASTIVSQYKGVRALMVERQREIAKNISVVVDGRDICAVVLPDADVKIYLTASAEERAKRRYLEKKEKGLETDYQKVLADIITRDMRDMTREVSPLIKTEDATEVDTTCLDMNGVIDRIMEIANNRKREK